MAAVLVLLSLALATIYLREPSDGVLHGAQRVGLSITSPLAVAGERASRPFRDAWGWTSDLLHARSENERLRDEVEALRQRVILNEAAARENEELRALAQYRAGPRFPEDYGGVVTRVVSRPATAYAQEVVIAAGSSDGVRRNDPVVTEVGLVGLVTEVAPSAAKVTLVTDQESAVSALVLESGAAGVVRRGAGGSLILDRVPKEEVVGERNLVVTAGWRTGNLESLYPYGIPIGTVTGVGQQDVDLYKRIQVTPVVDLDSLSSVLVLVPDDRAAG